jgi:hypothetical protein
VNLHLYDRDFVGQDFLGEVKISLSKLLESSGDAIEQWFTLEKEPTKTYNKETKKPAQVQVKIHYPKVRLKLNLRLRLIDLFVVLSLVFILLFLLHSFCFMGERFND